MLNAVLVPFVDAFARGDFPGGSPMIGHLECSNLTHIQIPKFSLVTDAMCEELHWLPVCQQIHFKLCYVVHNCVVSTAPACLQEPCVPVREVV